MIDWPLSTYDGLKNIPTKDGGYAYVFFMTETELFGVHRSPGVELYESCWQRVNGQSRGGGNSNSDLIQPKREAERWFVWDHNVDSLPNPQIQLTEEDTDYFIKKYSGTIVKVIVPCPGDDNE